MKMLIVLLTFISLTVACRKDNDAPKALAPAAPQSQNETLPTGGGKNNSGGGIDSSGGDLMTSSEGDVDQALKNIEDKVYDVAFRMAYELTGAEKLEFESKFGADTYKLVRDMFINPGRLNVVALDALKKRAITFNLVSGVCDGDHQDKAGSASWTSDGKPEVCLSRTLLRKMSPDSLQIDVLALALHEISHLYGYDETKAQAIQAFVLKNKGLLWPHPDQIKEILNSSDDLLRLTTNLLVQFRDKQNIKMCNTLNLMEREILEIIKSPEENKSIIVPSFVFSMMEFLPMVTHEAIRKCDNNDIAGIRTFIAKTVKDTYSQAVSVNNAIRYFANPSKPGSFYTTFDYLNVMTLFENEEISLAIAPKVDPKTRIEMEDVQCQMTSYSEDGQLVFKDVTYSGQLFHGDKKAGVGTIPYNIDGQSPFMLRRIEGQRGIGFGFMTEDAVISKVEAMMGTNGSANPKNPVYAAFLIPGVNESFQFEANYARRIFKVRCGFKSNGKNPDLKFKEPEKRDPKAHDSNDDHFESAPKKTTQLRVRLNKAGEMNKAGGPDLGSQPLTKIRYNGLIILESATEKCTLPESMVKDKKLEIIQFAQDIRDGKYSEIICDMNGEQRGGRVSHAPWAFEFSVR